MGMNEGAMLDKIREIVRNKIGADQDLFATVSRIENLIGIRTVEILIGHNATLNGLPQNVKDVLDGGRTWVSGLIMPTLQAIVKDLEVAGYSIAGPETYNYSIGGIMFRLSLSPVFQKKEVEIVTSKDDKKDSGTVTWA